MNQRDRAHSLGVDNPVMEESHVCDYVMVCSMHVFPPVSDCGMCNNLGYICRRKALALMNNSLG